MDASQNESKNFVKLYCEELSSKEWSMWQHHIHQNVFFWKLSATVRPLLCWQQDSLLLTGPGTYPQTYHITPCPALLISKAVKKNKGGEGCVTICCLFLYHPKNCLPFPFGLTKKKRYLDTQLKTGLTDLFWKLPGSSLLPRVGIGWWTLLHYPHM